ncbi:MAG TPA: hypothetical protein DHW61_06715 [Lachnoclostridium phytofermentans]|uniref:endo-1,4-beta-xylanase n=2 Tax=Lachnoclostridium TaxID=1506553 RepID=A0A3D2X6X1_9FIRM|nr:hypothetical protein [Lachnoclostridium phytofermentans]
MNHIENIASLAELDNFLDAQIEQNRKGDFEVLFLDQLGELSNVSKISVEQTDHDFTFGICPNGHISMTNALACGVSNEAELYWKLIGELFNATTLWFGWRVLEPLEGQWTYKKEVNGYGPMENMIKRAKELNHKITAHAVLYPRNDVSPDFLHHCTPEEALKFLERHTKKLVEAYKDDIDFWHPVNEAYAGIQEVGALKVNEGLVYKWVRDVDPSAQLVDNGGYTIHPEFYEKGIKNAHLYGADVDYLGIRGYFEYYNAESLLFYKKLWNHFDHLTSLYGKKIKFTEIGACSKNPSRSYDECMTDDPTVDMGLGLAKTDAAVDAMMTEETQAIFLEKMYKLMFAHSNVYECSYWDLLDNYTWNQVDGGLVRKDFSPKPAYRKLQELIHKTWHTKEEVEVIDGVLRFRGFYGIYKLNINGKEYSVSLTKGNNKAVIALV